MSGIVTNPIKEFNFSHTFKHESLLLIVVLIDMLLQLLLKIWELNQNFTIMIIRKFSKSGILRTQYICGSFAAINHTDLPEIVTMSKSSILNFVISIFWSWCSSSFIQKCYLTSSFSDQIHISVIIKLFDDLILWVMQYSVEFWNHNCNDIRHFNIS